MLKRTFVSLYHSLNGKNIRFYYTPPIPEEHDKHLLKDKNYHFISLQEFKQIQEQEFKKTQRLIEIQESNIKDINNKLTKQTRLIEDIIFNTEIVVNGLKLTSYLCFVFNLARFIYEF